MKKSILVHLLLISVFIRADDLTQNGIDGKITELKDRITFFNQYAELVEYTDFTSPQSALNESTYLNDDYERIEDDVKALRQHIRSTNDASFGQRLAELDRLIKQAQEHQRKAMEALSKKISNNRVD